MKRFILSSFVLISAIFSFFVFNRSSYQQIHPTNNYGSIYLSNGYGQITNKVTRPIGVKSSYYDIAPNRGPALRGNEKVFPNAPTVNQINTKTGGPLCLDLFGKCFF